MIFFFFFWLSYLLISIYYDHSDVICNPFTNTTSTALLLIVTESAKAVILVIKVVKMIEAVTGDFNRRIVIYLLLQKSIH